MAGPFTGAKSNYLETSILDHVLGVAAFTAPTALHLGLTIQDPTESGAYEALYEPGPIAGTGGYNRAVVTTEFDAAAVGTVLGQTIGATSTMTGTITYGAASLDWGTITHWGLYDAATAGNMLYYGEFTTAKAINSGDTVQISSGDLTIEER